MGEIEFNGTVLLTGFGAFGNIAVNPSWELVKAFVKETPTIEVDNRIYEIKAPPAAVPVTYSAVDQGASSGDLYGSGEQAQAPCLVVHCGVGQFPNGLVLENIASNDGYRLPDCDGKTHESGICVAGAPPVLRTTLDLERVRDEAIPSCTTEIVISADAGRYLCEYIFYKSLHAAIDQCATGLCPLAAGPAALFVHVPPKFGQPCSMDQLVASLHNVLKSCLRQLQDQSALVKDLAEMIGSEPPRAATLLRESDFNVEVAASRFFDAQEGGS